MDKMDANAFKDILRSEQSTFTSLSSPVGPWTSLGLSLLAADISMSIPRGRGSVMITQPGNLPAIGLFADLQRHRTSPSSPNLLLKQACDDCPPQTNTVLTVADDEWFARRMILDLLDDQFASFDDYRVILVDNIEVPTMFTSIVLLAIEKAMKIRDKQKQPIHIFLISRMECTGMNYPVLSTKPSVKAIDYALLQPYLPSNATTNCSSTRISPDVEPDVVPRTDMAAIKIEEIIDKAVSEDLLDSTGILVVLPTSDDLNTLVRHLPATQAGMRIQHFIVDSKSTQEEALAAIRAPTPKVVLTNHLEAGVSYQNIQHVIDAGLYEEHVFDPRVSDDVRITTVASQSQVLDRISSCYQANSVTLSTLYTANTFQAMRLVKISPLVTRNCLMYVLVSCLLRPGIHKNEMVTQMRAEVALVHYAVRQLQWLQLVKETKPNGWSMSNKGKEVMKLCISTPGLNVYGGTIIMSIAPSDHPAFRSALIRMAVVLSGPRVVFLRPGQDCYGPDGFLLSLARSTLDVAVGMTPTPSQVGDLWAELGILQHIDGYQVAWEDPNWVIAHSVAQHVEAVCKKLHRRIIPYVLSSQHAPLLQDMEADLCRRLLFVSVSKLIRIKKISQRHGSRPAQVIGWHLASRSEVNLCTLSAINFDSNYDIGTYLVYLCILPGKCFEELRFDRLVRIPSELIAELEKKSGKDIDDIVWSRIQAS